METQHDWKSVLLNVRNRSYLTLAVLAVLGGCNNQQNNSNPGYSPPTSNPGVGGTPPQGNPGSDPANGSVPGTGTAPSTGPKNPIKDPKFPPKTFEIPDKGKNGYQPSASPLSSLGQKMDQAAMDTQDALCEASTTMEVGGAKLIGLSKIKIKDSKTYSIEYYMPETEATLNKIIADGTRRAVFHRDKWTFDGQPGSADADLSANDVASWPRDCLHAMFAQYESGKRTWGPLLAAWSRGEGGYSATIEEQTAMVLGKKRPLYQVLAKRKADGTQVQIVVDGQRYLPLTVRSVTKGPKGTDDKVLWTATWKFGGHHPDSDFAIPVKPTGP